jgi:protocatechuate 3,4-dioxygenase, beta subunit
MALGSQNVGRRGFLGAVAAAAGTAMSARGLADEREVVPGEFANQLALTPSQTEGPFYPNPLPLSQDNDLLVLGDSTTEAVGEVTHLHGQVLSAAGEPLQNATVEIWQADATGAYIHPGSEGHDQRDKHFQGFGRFETGSDGRYYFRTVKPGKYPGRAPHIHVLVNHRGKRLVASQLYIRGLAANRRDGSLMSIRDLQVRQNVLIDFAPLPGSKVKQLIARADLIVGVLPDDPKHE